MSESDRGGKAFPSHGTMGEVTHEGMTLRQWFAGMALQGLLANRSAIVKQLHIPELCFEYADAMIRAGKGEK